MYTISFFNNKGGVGKTTSVISVALQLSKQGKRVLLVDLDPQGNCSDTAGVFDGSEEAKTIYTLLTEPLHEQNEEERKELFEQTIQFSDMTGCDMIPSNILLDGFQDSVAHSVNREYRLKKLFSYIDKTYDYCIIDCPPSLSLLTTNALVASDSIVIPCDSSKYALTGMANLFRKFNEIKEHCNNDLSILGILNTKVDHRYKTAKISKEKLQQHFGELVFTQDIPKNAAVEKAQYEEKTLFSYGKNNPILKAYEEVTKEMVQRVKEKTTQ